MTLPADVNLIARVLPYLPGSIQGAGGITVTQAGTVWTVGTPSGFSIDGSGSITVANTFSAWTPTYSAAGGTLGTTTTNAARFFQFGKMVHFYLDVSITSAGTSPTGFFKFTLPVTPKLQFVVGALSGWEQTNNVAFNGYVLGNGFGNEGRIDRYDGSATAGVANGSRIVVSGMYEAA